MADGHEVGEKPEVGRGRVRALDLRREHEGVQPGARLSIEVTDHEAGRLPRRIAQRHDQSLRRHTRQRSGQALAPDRLEHEREGLTLGRQRADNDICRSQFVQPLAALRPANDSCHMRPLLGRKLDDEAADAAGGAGDGNPTAIECMHLDDPSCRHPRNGQRGRGVEAHVVGEVDQSGRRQRHSFAPRPRRGEADNPRPLAGSGAIGSSFFDNAGDVPPGPPPGLRVLQGMDFAPVQRCGPHVDERLVGPRLGLGDVDQIDVAIGTRGGDQGLHRVSPRRGSRPSSSPGTDQPRRWRPCLGSP